MGKGEIARYEQFLLFLQCFQKTFTGDTLKPGFVWERVNPFPSKPWFLCVCNTSLLKTLWEKKKMLVMSNFSFSQCFFYCLENFLSFSSKLKLSSAKTFSLEGLKFVVWERVNNPEKAALWNIVEGKVEMLVTVVKQKDLHVTEPFHVLSHYQTTKF